MPTKNHPPETLPQSDPRPLLVVVSAPSGAGKTTLCDRLRRELPALVYSISCTTRPPRGGELDGVQYHFLQAAEFERRVRAGEFLEHAEVHGQRYGTLKATVRDALRAGRDVLMAIDVQGARQIREAVQQAPAGDPLRRALVDIFIVPPSLALLRQRLEKRGEDSAEVIEHRLRNAEKELRCWREYQYLVVNDQLDEAYAQLRAILRAEHGRILPAD